MLSDSPDRIRDSLGKALNKTPSDATERKMNVVYPHDSFMSEVPLLDYKDFPGRVK